MPHVGFVGFEVEGFAAGFADDFAQVGVFFDELFDAGDVAGAVACGFEFVGEVGVAAEEVGCGFVEFGALGFAVFQVGREFGVAAEVADVGEVVFGRGDGFAEEMQGFEGVVEAIASFFEAILEEDLGVRSTIALVEFGGVDGDRVFDFAEEVFVIDDVAEVFIVAVEAVGAADGLKESVVLHTFVDVEVGASGGIKAGQQLIDNDQQLHVSGLEFEFFFGLLLVGFGFGFVGERGNILGQFGVEIVDKLFVRFGVGSGVFGGDIFVLGVVGGYDGAFAFEGGLLEAFVVLTGFVDAGDDEDGVAAIGAEAGFNAEVEGDVGNNAIDARAGTEDFLHGAPFFAEGGFLPVVESSGFGIEPAIDSGFGAEFLVDVAGFVNQVKDDFIFNGFAEFVGVDVFAEDFETGLSVFFEEGGTCEADEGCRGHEGFHGAVELAALGAVAFIDEYEDVADGFAGLSFQVFDELFKVFVFDVSLTEFVDEGAEEPGVGLAEAGHEISAALGAVDGFACVGEYVGDLFVEFGAIGDDDNAGIGDVFEYPLGKEHHCYAFAAALGVPDNTALTIANIALGGLDAKVLMDSGQFFDACVEEDEVVDDVEEAGFGANFEQVFIEFVAAVVLLVLFPGEEVFFGGADRAVAQSFGVVAGEDDLDGAEEAADEFRLLVGEALADAFADFFAAVFEFDDADRNTVDVEHNIGAFFFFAVEGNFFGDREVVGFWVLPVNELNGFGVLAGGGFDLDAVAQEFVDFFVVVVEASSGFVGGAVEFVEGLADLVGSVALLGEVGGEEGCFDVAVELSCFLGAVLPVAEIGVV